MELDTKVKSQKISSKRRKISEYIIDETMIKIGSEFIWLWIAIEPKNMEILALSISKERNMFVVERFLSGLVDEYGKHPVSIDGGTWYRQACRFLNLKYHIHSSLEKSIIERTIQYIKDRIESFDDYFPCRLKNCKLKHVMNWLNMLSTIITMNWKCLSEQSHHIGWIYLLAAITSKWFLTLDP